MPRVEIAVKTKDGQTIVLSPEDRLEKTVTIECNSSRCASRHGQDKPQEVSLVEGEPMPDAGEQWMSLILPEKSPQYTPTPPNFCGPQCVRDFLVYDYLAPVKSTPTVQPDIQAHEQAIQLLKENKGYEQVTYEGRPETSAGLYQGVKIESFSHPVIPQADGDPGDVHGA